MTQGKPPVDLAPYVAFLEQALASPCGIEVPCESHLATHRQRFYTARRGRADLEKVKVRTSTANPTTHLWLIPESVEEAYNAHEAQTKAGPNLPDVEAPGTGDEYPESDG